ncbi:MAG TPA: hypothetical protein DCZ97_11995 [Syntrophus sp. (in: bacteria)]|nr:MAG: hypothetical protein A2X92_00985 [Syntrophus sp. GWC2_56_31]HBB17669.1 hypothetical protein [Syntrophus sp. (in: bacteria)]
MKKFITFLIFVLIACGLYLVSGMILEMASDRAIDTIVKNIKSPNIEYTRPQFRDVNFSSYDAVTWEGVSFDVRIVRDETAKTAEELSIMIGAMTISLESFSEPAVLLDVKGLSALAKEGGSGVMSDISRAGDRMERGNLKVLVKLKGFSKRAVYQQVRDLIREINMFSTNGATKIPISFSATEVFEIRKKSYTAKLSVEKKDDEYRLVMDKDDLKIVAAAMSGEKATGMDIEVISRNPIKAPQLLRIRDKAAVTAKLARQRDPSIPEDAYRHTLWNYLLAKTFGEAFAKEVTDAHEVFEDEAKMSKEAIENMNIESYQDLNNNAVGRSYAKMEYPESDILKLVLTDPAVIRDENRKARYSADDYQKLKPAYIKTK